MQNTFSADMSPQHISFPSLKIRILFLTSILFCTVPSAVLAQQAPSAWTVTLPGAPSSTPCPTSFGFIALSDNKIISSVTSSGTVLYQHFLQESLSPWFTVLPSDHLCLVQADGKTVRFINPDGTQLWTVTLPFTVSQNPLYCDNGSIIFFGNTDIAAVSCTGILLWEHHLAEPWTLPPFVTSNGLLAFSSVTESGTTIEFISPFGVPLFSTSFTDRFTSLSSGAGRIFGITKDGSAVCYSFSGRKLTKTWSTSSDEPYACIVPIDTRVLLLTSGGTLTMVNANNGKELSSEHIWELPLENIRCISRNSAIVLAGDTVSRTVTYILSNQGKTIWMKNLPSRDPVFMTRTGLLCQYAADWSVTVWDTPAAGSNILTSYTMTSDCLSSWGQDALPEDYAALRDTLSMLSERSLSSSAVHKQESYGELGQLLQYYLSDIRKSAVSGWDFSALYAQIITNETDTALLKETLAAAGVSPYDNARQVLNAIELRLKNNRSGIFNDSLCFETCNTVYRICAFMGTPAIINQGQRILSQLIQPQYTTKVQQQAISTIKALIELQKDTK